MEGTATMNFLSKKLNLYYSFINLRLFFNIHFSASGQAKKKKERKVPPRLLHNVWYICLNFPQAIINDVYLVY